MSNEITKLGKIFWILDDFKYIGSYPDDEATHQVAYIDSFVGDENMIKITTEPTDFGDGKISISININRENNLKYVGKFHLVEEQHTRGKVEAELFENQAKFFLFGTWEEVDEEGFSNLYTWFAEINKHKGQRHITSAKKA